MKQVSPYKVLPDFAGFVEWHSGKSAVSFGKSLLWLFFVWALPRLLSGLLFSLDETQIWLGDLRVVVVVGLVFFWFILICQL